MRQILDDVQTWMKEGKAVALATVIHTWGSAPRASGSKMAVSDRGEMSGSVSGGCVEAAVVDEALQALKDGRPRRVHYGVSDEAAWEIGLSCGGTIDVMVEPLLTSGRASMGSRLMEALGASLTESASSVRAIVVEGPDDVFGDSSLIGHDGEVTGEIESGLTKRLVDDARAVLRSGMGETRAYAYAGRELEILLDPVLPPPTLVIVGGVHIAIVLTRLATVIGYRVVIVDPRGAFTTPERFPQAVVLEKAWPDEGLRKARLTATSAVAVLSHDPKLDDPALLVALRSPAFYVGALGSSRTQALRRSRLLAAGLTEDEVSRLHGPIGIDIGRGEPESIALGILTEIVATRAGRTLATARAPAARMIERPERDP